LTQRFFFSYKPEGTCNISQYLWEMETGNDVSKSKVDYLIRLAHLPVVDIDE
jgi:hypothetical protein